MYTNPTGPKSPGGTSFNEATTLPVSFNFSPEWWEANIDAVLRQLDYLKGPDIDAIKLVLAYLRNQIKSKYSLTGIEPSFGSQAYDIADASENSIIYSLASYFSKAEYYHNPKPESKSSDSNNIYEDGMLLQAVLQMVTLLKVLGLNNCSHYGDEDDPKSRVRSILPKFLALSQGNRDRLLVLTEKGVINSDNIEIFLSLEFGDDFGGIILNIAQNLDTEKLQEIIDIMISYRCFSKIFSGWYESFDPQFALATELAMNERLTDILVVLEQLALGQKVDVNILGNINFSEDDVDKVIQTMRDLETSLRLMTEIIPAEDTMVNLVNSDESNFTAFRFTNSVGTVILYVRPEASYGYDPLLEYGKKGVGVEASISWLVNPADPQDASWSKKDDKISIRFDREGRLVDEDPFNLDRDPIRENGSIALDISSLFGNKDSAKARIGRTVAAGNIIRSETGRCGKSMHHNNHYFDQVTYGSREGFISLANYTIAMARARIALQEGSHSSSNSNRVQGIGTLAQIAA